MNMITHDDGSQEWLENGLYHRLDGAALIWADGTQEWYVNGHLHRLDGPAVIGADGIQQWWVDGRRITRQVTTWMKRRNVTWPWDQDAQVEFMLTWA